MNTANPAPLPGVVHVIAATFREEVAEELAASTLERARSLREAPGAQAVLVGQSGRSVIVATWLPDRGHLEPFAASRPHMEFVMRGLAPSIAGMWSAAIESDTPAPDPGDVALLWAFAVRTAETAFEWQVRQVLQSLERLPARVVAGLTFEERDRYRAGGVACVAADDVEAFRAALDQARADWGDLAPHVVESTGVVVP